MQVLLQAALQIHFWSGQDSNIKQTISIPNKEHDPIRPQGTQNHTGHISLCEVCSVLFCSWSWIIFLPLDVAYLAKHAKNRVKIQSLLTVRTSGMILQDHSQFERKTILILAPKRSHSCLVQKLHGAVLDSQKGDISETTPPKRPSSHSLTFLSCNNVTDGIRPIK